MFSFHFSARRALITGAVAVLLSGCGGDPSTSVADLKGFWSGATGSSVGKAVSLGDGTLWLVEESNSVPLAVTKGTWSTTGGAIGASGRRTVVATSVASDVSLSVNAFGPKASLTGTFNNAPLNWSYASAGEGTLTAASLQGAWTGQFNQGAVGLTWNLAANGKISGTSTTGCVYDGTLSDRTDGLKVVDLKVSENCAGTIKSLSGIGTADTTLKLASFPYVVDNGSGAGVFRLTKQ